MVTARVIYAWKMGMFFHTLALFDSMTVEENIIYVPKLRMFTKMRRESIVYRTF
jgi:ABC-type transporter Mla maintaining outer membrane lipid asymmetry ATPase subunit MlaF